MTRHLITRCGGALVGAALAALLFATGARAEPMSALFPYCWGGNENGAIFYTEGLMTRQIVLYGNTDETRPLTKVQLILDLPLGAAELVYAVASDGPGRVLAGEPQVVGPDDPFDPTKPRLWKTPLYHNAQGGDTQQADSLYRGEPYAHYVIPLWDIRPGYRWRGKTPWSEWPGSWTTLYIKGKKPGSYAVYWQLRTAQVEGPERMAPLQVLERPKTPAVTASGPGAGVGVWVNSLSMYGDFPPVAHGLAGTLKACGVRRLYLTSRSALSVAAARAAGLQVFLTNPWPSDAFAATEPPADYRARDEKGAAVPGPAWCPTYVAWGGDQWEAAVAPLVTGDLKTLGAEGYLLDADAVGAPGFAPCDLCFCARCRDAFAKELGGGMDWPRDVRPGGRYHKQWLAWRKDQTAWYVKRLADMARAANPQAQVYMRSPGCYEPYPDHEVYSAGCSDLALCAKHLTAASVKAIIYPNHASEAFAPDSGFGTETGNYGTTLPDMVALVRQTVTRLAPRPVIACLAGAPPPFAPAAPLATTALLRWQAVNHLLDGAVGLDFWNLGPCEDGRYLGLLAELAGLCGTLQVGPGGATPVTTGVTTEARYARVARVLTRDGPCLLLLNGDSVARKFSLGAGAESRSIGLAAGEARLVPTKTPEPVTQQPAAGGQEVRNPLKAGLTVPSVKARLSRPSNACGPVNVAPNTRHKPERPRPSSTNSDDGIL